MEDLNNLKNVETTRMPIWTDPKQIQVKQLIKKKTISNLPTKADDAYRSFNNCKEISLFLLALYGRDCRNIIEILTGHSLMAAAACSLGLTDTGRGIVSEATESVEILTDKVYNECDKTY